jgi:hypothetical protein
MVVAVTAKVAAAGKISLNSCQLNLAAQDDKTRTRNEQSIQKYSENFTAQHGASNERREPSDIGRSSKLHK